jgi:predicted nucleic acid-binding protein
VAQTRIRLFFDASALFATANSSTGGARELLRLAIQGIVLVLISQEVLEETIRNLERKAPEKVAVFKELLVLLELEVVCSPTRAEISEAEEYVAQKDAPIIAAVKKSQVDFFVNLDKKHLLERPNLAIYTSTIIGTPREALEYLRGEEGN